MYLRIIERNIFKNMMKWWMYWRLSIFPDPRGKKTES